MSNIEQTVFGENSASGVVIISASSFEIGVILHANEEIRNMFGHAPKDLLGKNVTILMPSLYAQMHDGLIS
jgi:PAS domain S-box-containing protein